MTFIDRLLPAPVGGGLAQPNYWVWCGSAIHGEDGRYHLYAARWPRELPFFDGYKCYSEIVHAVSKTPEGPYRVHGAALPARGEGYWDGRMTHNPTVLRYGDLYLLFYIGATYAGSAPTAEELHQKMTTKPAESYASIRIGLATARSVYGPWKRRDAPILLPRPGKWDSTVVTNPAPCVLADGRILMLYRSNTPQGLRVGAAIAAGPDAPFERASDEPVLRFSGNNNVEDPFLWRAGDHCELLAKDMTGGITGEKHAGIHAVSPDGLNWTLSDPPKAYSRTVRWSDGATTTQGCLERPQLLIEEGVPTHLFAATGDGPGGFDNCTRTWNMVIPLTK